MTYVIAYDIGTTGVKTCLFSIGETIRLVSSAQQGYDLYILPGGGAEQDADQWWEAMCATTRKLFTGSEVRPEQVAGLSFCSQMQGLVLVDRYGRPVRRPMSYMDRSSKRASLTASKSPEPTWGSSSPASASPGRCPAA